MPITLGAHSITLKAQRELARALRDSAQASERLSSGMRINRASDDPAALALAGTLNNDARVLSQGLRNLNDGISVLNIADSALTELSSLVVRQKELATQSANGVYTASQRRALTTEAEQLTREFNRIVETTKFNGRNIFSADSSELRLQAGVGVENSLAFNLGQEFGRSLGSGQLSSASVISLGSSQRSVENSDFNNDGDLDLAIATNGVTVVRLGNGDGTFRASSTITGSGGLNLVIADFNYDGREDILSAVLDGTIALALGNADGSFSSATAYTATIGNSAGLQAVDVNRDGVLDVIEATVSSTIGVFIGNSNGSFRAVSTYTGLANGHGLALGDFNQDGALDIVSGSFATGGLEMRYGVGNGTFGAALSLSSSNAAAFIEVQDFNRDGLDDLLFSGSSGTSIRLGLGAGAFAAELELQTPAGEARFADANGDGLLDIVASNYTFDAVSVHIGNGDGTFRAARTYSTATGGDAYELSSGDFDNDGALDLVVTDYTAGSFSLLRGVAETRFDTLHLNLSQQDDALAALPQLDEALARISAERSQIGAFQSRIESALSVTSVLIENYRTAAGRMTDADIAEESANLIRAQIIAQMAGAVLRSSGLDARIVLELLQD